nr:hypothetical protein [Micromonospora sp. DSM 115978]
MDPHLTAATTIATLPIAITLGYAVVCWISPFTRCKRCAGTGHTTSRILRRPRACRRCDHGMRLRAGRRVYNFFHRLRAEVTR